MRNNLRVSVRRALAALLVAACMTGMMGCTAGEPGVSAAPNTSPPVISAAPEPTQPAASAEVPAETVTESPIPEEPPADCGARELFERRAEGYDPNGEELFTLPEFPGVQFLRRGGTAYVLYGDTRRYVLGGSPLYLADLNGDGCREFCTTAMMGSGIVDYRIYVYDFADDMRYTLHQRMDYDYDLSLEDGRLVGLRYAYRGIDRGQEPLCEGELVIEDRQLFFVSGDLRVQGIVESYHFDEVLLQDIIGYAQRYIDEEMWLPIYFRPATNYYMARHEEDIRPAVVEEEERRVWLDLGSSQGDRDVLRYVAVLELLTGYYVGYSLLEEYVYYDPANPARVFVCTELRDCGYRDIRSYYEDLVAGKCQPHPDTFVVYLDRHAVCRWGEETNLYPESE